MTKVEFKETYFDKAKPFTFFVLRDESYNIIGILYKNRVNKMKRYINALTLTYEDSVFESSQYIDKHIFTNVKNVMTFDYEAFIDYMKDKLLNGLYEYIETIKKEDSLFSIINTVDSFGGKNVNIAYSSDINKNYYLICATSSDEDYYYILYDYERNRLIAETCCSKITLSDNQNILLNDNNICNLLNTYFSRNIEVPISKIYINKDKLNKNIKQFNYEHFI